MSFFGFSSNKEKIEKVSNLLEDENKYLIKNVTKLIEFKENELEKFDYIQINDFIDNSYGNIRPKNLIINCTIYNQNIIKECTFSYLHTPLRKQDLQTFKRCNFSIQKKFDKTLEYINSTPYITYCQTNDKNEIIDIDLSQITNANLYPERNLHLSLGSICLLINRLNTGKCNIELSYTLKYLFKSY